MTTRLPSVLLLVVHLFLSHLVLAPGARAAAPTTTVSRVSQALEKRLGELHRGCSHRTLGLDGAPRAESSGDGSLVELRLQILAEDVPALLEVLEALPDVELEGAVFSLSTEIKTVNCAAHGPERPYPSARVSLAFELRSGKKGASGLSRTLRALIPRLTTNHFLAFGKPARPRPPRAGDPPPPTPPSPEELRPLLRDLRVDGDGRLMANLLVPDDRSAVDRAVARFRQDATAPVADAEARRVEETTERRRPVLQVEIRGTLSSSGQGSSGAEGPLLIQTAPEPSPPSLRATPAAIRAAIRGALGAPYLSGGTNPRKGLSATGLVRYVHARLGLRDLPRTAREILADPRAQRVPRKGYRPELGDVLFFLVPSKGGKSLLPAIVSDPDRGVFVMAHRKRGVVEVQLGQTRWKKRLRSIRRFFGP